MLGVARLAMQHVGDFEGKPIQTWVYARDRDAGFYNFAVPTKQVMGFFDEHVGPFAYEKLANIVSPATGGGREAATAIMYGKNSVTGERTTRWRNVIIHEVAHQWFGNAVTEHDWNDVWLSEGFATYFTLLFIEHAYGRDEMVAGLGSAAQRVWTWYDDHPEYRIVHDNLDDMGRVTSVATYQKGAWVLHMLRKRMGDEAFWAGIQSYYARHMNGSASTTDFRRAMEEASGLDLESFFDQWLYPGRQPPSRRMVGLRPHRTRGAHRNPPNAGCWAALRTPARSGHVDTFPIVLRKARAVMKLRSSVGLVIAGMMLIAGPIEGYSGIPRVAPCRMAGRRYRP